MPGKNRSKFIPLIWEGILKLQRKTRLLAVLEGLPGEKADRSVSYTEALVLHVIESIPDQNVKEIASILQLERSWVSRLVTALEDQKLVKAFIPEADKRSKRVRISKKGKEELLRLNAFRGKIVSESVSNLSKKELKQLVSYFSKFCNDLGAPRYITQGSHPIDDEMARMSWVMGVVGNDFMRSGLNVTQYQICMLLDLLHEGEVTTSELYEDLPFDMSTISRAVSGFERNDLVEKKQLKDDKRSFSVNFTGKGKKFWEEKKKAAYELFSHGLRGFANSDLSDLVDLLEQVTTDLPRRKRAVLADRVEIEKIDFDNLEDEIREYFEREFQGKKNLGLNAQGKAPSDYYVVSHNEELKGVAAVRKNPADQTVEQFLFSGKNLDFKDCLRFVKASLKSSD